jgi:hypothetical protein
MHLNQLTTLEQPHQCNLQQILDDEKSKHDGLVQQNGFGPAFLLRLAKGTAEPNTYC